MISSFVSLIPQTMALTMVSILEGDEDMCRFLQEAQVKSVLFYFVLLF